MRRLALFFVLAALLCSPSSVFGQQPANAAALFAQVVDLAAQGDKQAILDMGIMHERGIGTPVNFGKALEWYRKAANAGLAEGYYNTAVCYEIGMGTAVEPGRALANYEKAASMGLAAAHYKLASMSLSGQGAPHDIAKGLASLAQAAEAGHSGAANELGVICLLGQLGQQKDEQKAFRLFTRAAELGNLEAIKNIAVIHKDGLGQPQSPAKALTWYLIAQKGGYLADLAPIISELEGSLSPEDIQAARNEADAWNAAFEQRGQNEGGR